MTEHITLKQMEGKNIWIYIFLTEFGSNYQMHFLALDEMDTLLGFIDANIYEFRISISSIYVFEEYRGNGKALFRIVSKG